MATPTQTQRTEPLTPAQVEMVEKMIADRQDRLLDTVTAMIEAAVSPLQDQSVQYGHVVALRINSGKIMCVKLGGPTEDEKPIELETRPDIGPWESVIVERGSK